jgi:uncharacterized lipoprotein YmbA
MLARRIAQLMLSLAVVAAAASGCGTTAPSRFYTLDATAAADGAAPVAAAIMVGPVSVPAAVDRPQFVVQAAPNRVEVDEFNRWAAPLNDSIAQAVAGDLVKLLGTPQVAAGPLANFAPAYRVTIEVQRFDSVPGQAALLAAVWTVRRTADAVTRTGRTVAREPVQGGGFDALAAAHSRALATMSADIAAAIRAEAEDRPHSDKP